MLKKRRNQNKKVKEPNDIEAAGKLYLSTEFRVKTINAIYTIIIQEAYIKCKEILRKTDIKGLQDFEWGLWQQANEIKAYYRIACPEDIRQEAKKWQGYYIRGVHKPTFK